MNEPSKQKNKKFFHKPNNSAFSKPDPFLKSQDALRDELYGDLKSFLSKDKTENSPIKPSNSETNLVNSVIPSKKKSKKSKKKKRFNPGNNESSVANATSSSLPIKKEQAIISKVVQAVPVNSNSNHIKPVSLEPRDMQHFIMKPRGSSQKNFPYSTPRQAFLIHKPIFKETHRKKIDKDILRIIPFGGLEQVGINCMGFEYGNEVVVIDMGVQFPDEHTHGISVKITDISYLRGKNVKAVFITHGHIDHIGAVIYLMRAIGTHVPIYAPLMALELIKIKQKEFNIPLDLREVKLNKIINACHNFQFEPFTVDHSIPDSVGVRIHTPVGKIVHTGDWKFDSDPNEDINSVNHEQLKQFGNQGVLALLSDSTNAHLTGSSLTEKIVIEPMENIFAQAQGRIITGTFSSIIERLQIIIHTAQKFNRKVVLLGKGMHTYFDIAKKLNYIKTLPNTMIEMADADKLPDDQVCICCTGAQGERYAALMRIATGESKDTEFKSGDTVILSSSVIPGNERKVQELMDILEEQEVSVHHYRQTNVHAGGHAREEDVKMMIKEIRPKYFIPIYGSRFMLHSNGRIAKSLGYKDENIFIARNGQIIEFSKDKGELTNNYASHRIMAVDGFMVGFTREKEFLERFQMQQEGIIIVNIIAEKNSWKINLITHGFVDLNLIPEVKTELINLVKNICDSQEYKSKKDEETRSIRRKIQHLIRVKLGKEPVVIIIN